MELPSLPVVLIAILIICLVLFMRLDADIILTLYEKFGKRPRILKENVVWITGASSGIGEHLAYELASHGCKLILSARRETELDRVKKQCILSGKLTSEDIYVLPLDVTAFDTHASAVENVIRKFGKVDILVNNAGRLAKTLFSKTSLKTDRLILDVNCLGVLSMSKTLLPHFLERNSGHFVIISSTAGKAGSALFSSYSGTKFALHGWFESLQQELCTSNIKVTMICPGPVTSNIVENKIQEEAFYDPPVNEAGSLNMTTPRCAQLIAVSIANQLSEVWITKSPFLQLIYLNQYFPILARRLWIIITKTRMKNCVQMVQNVS